MQSGNLIKIPNFSSIWNRNQKQSQPVWNGIIIPLLSWSSFSDNNCQYFFNKILDLDWKKLPIKHTQFANVIAKFERLWQILTILFFGLIIEKDINYIILQKDG